MITLSQLLPDSDPEGPAGELRLAQAYGAFARGKPSAEDCELILVDLAMVSGYFSVPEPGIDNETLQHDGGARRVYGRIVRMINMTPNELSGLITAVIEETRAKGI